MAEVVAEAPTGVARAHLYIVRGSPPSLSIIQVFHQVMSPGRRAYLLKKHLLYFVVFLRSLNSRATSRFAARKSRNDITWPCHDSQQTIDQQPNVTQYRSVVDGMIISYSQ